MFQCLVCNNNLRLINEDSRQEWYTAEYQCPECSTNHEHRREFQIQSSLIASDRLYCIDDGGYEISAEDAERIAYEEQ
jgi:hypothetical protein